MFVVVGENNTPIQLDHGCRLTTDTRDKSEVTIQEDEEGHVRVTDKAFWTRSRQDSLRDVSEAML